MGQHVGKGLAQNVFLYLVAGTHLGSGVEAHRHIEKLAVEEGHASLHAPCRQTLVGTQTVVEVELGQLAHRLLMEGAGRGSLVEIEVAAEDFVGALAREHHFDTHRPDDAGEQIHGR